MLPKGRLGRDIRLHLKVRAGCGVSEGKECVGGFETKSCQE